MYDYIETMILRDQANEALYLDTLSHRVDRKSNQQQTDTYLDEKIKVELDDMDHKFHIYYHT